MPPEKIVIASNVPLPAMVPPLSTLKLCVVTPLNSHRPLLTWKFSKPRQLQCDFADLEQGVQQGTKSIETNERQETIMNRVKKNVKRNGTP